MKPENLHCYQSPDGAGPLDLSEVLQRDAEEIRTGTLECPASGRQFEIREGAPRLICTEDMTPRRCVDRRKIEYSDRMLDLQRRLGTLPATIAEAAHQHELERAARTEFLFSAIAYRQPRNRLLLDLGCGDPVLTRRFAKLGFRCFALDFAPYRLCRYGSRYVQEGEYFERVSALMSQLPFVSGLFDVVFVSAALHHATPNKEEDFQWCDPANMYDTLCEIRRVLKPHKSGGRLILAGEGVYPDNMPIEKRPLERAAKFNGCYESHYTMGEYISQFERAGIYPMFFANQLDGNLYIDGYLDDGTRVPLLRPEDLIDQPSIWRMRGQVRRNVPASLLRRILPNWIHLRRLPKPAGARGDSWFYTSRIFRWRRPAA